MTVVGTTTCDKRCHRFSVERGGQRGEAELDSPRCMLHDTINRGNQTSML